MLCGKAAWTLLCLCRLLPSLCLSFCPFPCGLFSLYFVLRVTLEYTRCIFWEPGLVVACYTEDVWSPASKNVVFISIAQQKRQAQSCLSAKCYPSYSDLIAFIVTNKQSNYRKICEIKQWWRFCFLAGWMDAFTVGFVLLAGSSAESNKSGGLFCPVGCPQKGFYLSQNNCITRVILRFTQLLWALPSGQIIRLSLEPWLHAETSLTSLFSDVEDVQ